MNGTGPAIGLPEDARSRCPWCGDDPLYVRYHDEEWGRPVHDGRALFEKLCLEAMQAGLSWITILRRRADLRIAFDGFEPSILATWSDDMLETVRERPGVIRHAGKIRAVRDNARAVLDGWPTLGDFAEEIWSHAPPPRARRPETMVDVPTRTPESEALARGLRARGLRFVGPVSAYAFMQSMGLVDDHLASCWASGGRRV